MVLYGAFPLSMKKVEGNINETDHCRELEDA